MFCYRYPIVSYCNPLLREFSVLADYIDRMQLLKVYKNNTETEIQCKRMYSGSSGNDNPCDVYIKALEKVEKEKEMERAILQQKKDQERLLWYENECINEQEKCWKKQVQLLPTKDPESKVGLYQNVSQDIKKICQQSAKRRLDQEKKKQRDLLVLAEIKRIRALMAKCEGMRCDKVSTDEDMETSCKKTKPKKDPKNVGEKTKESLSDEKDTTQKNRFKIKLDKCMKDQWAKVNECKQWLTEEEKLCIECDRKCLNNLFFQACKRKSLAESCAAIRSKCKKPEIEINQDVPEKASQQEKDLVEHEVDQVKMRHLDEFCKKEAALRPPCDPCEESEPVKQPKITNEQIEIFKNKIKEFRTCVYKTLPNRDCQCGSKVSIIGAGPMGIGCAVAIISKGITHDLVLVDNSNELRKSEYSDLMCGTSFLLRNCRIEKCSNLDSTSNSRVVVVTTPGSKAKKKKAKTDVDLETAKIIKEIMPELVKQSPKAVFLIVANPSDVMAWFARKVTDLPCERCFGTGCHLDSARFRMLIAQMIGVSKHSVNGFILGEQGCSSVPIWSAVTVGGSQLQAIMPEIGTVDDPMHWSKVHKDVVVASERAKEGKGCSNWALGLTVADVISAIFEDSHQIMTLSTNAQGICGIDQEVFFSLPCVVNKCGLHAVVNLQITNCERSLLRKSAENLLEAQCKIKNLL